MFVSFLVGSKVMSMQIIVVTVNNNCKYFL
ncbi:hypothetical protein DO72_5890 [Burkholderia pseudomallei]|nr:hypothetical protein DO72_5890 [Burkholderia pseudomallei]